MNEANSNVNCIQPFQLAPMLYRQQEYGEEMMRVRGPLVINDIAIK